MKILSMIAIATMLIGTSTVMASENVSKPMTTINKDASKTTTGVSKTKSIKKKIIKNSGSNKKTHENRNKLMKKYTNKEVS